MKTFTAVFLHKPCLLIYRYRNDWKDHRALTVSHVLPLPAFETYPLPIRKGESGILSRSYRVAFVTLSL